MQVGAAEGRRRGHPDADDAPHPARLRAHTYTAHEIDGIAAYCVGNGQCYWLPIEDFDGQGYVHLRLQPARNNQRRGLIWAAEHPLGAIAQLGERVTGSHEVGGSNPPSSISNVTPLA